MTKHEDSCRAFQEELAFAANQRPLRLQLETHLARCTNCRTFRENVSELAQLARLDRLEPPPDLVKRAMEQLHPELTERARQGFWLRSRLVIAGLVSLPVIVGINGSLVWIVYSSLEGWLSQPVATTAAYVVAASTLLGLSLVYGSLPLMAEWGLELRQRCQDIVTTATPRGLEATAFGSSK